MVHVGNGIGRGNPCRSWVRCHMGMGVGCLFGTHAKTQPTLSGNM